MELGGGRARAVRLDRPPRVSLARTERLLPDLVLLCREPEDFDMRESMSRRK